MKVLNEVDFENPFVVISEKLFMDKDGTFCEWVEQCPSNSTKHGCGECPAFESRMFVNREDAVKWWENQK